MRTTTHESKFDTVDLKLCSLILSELEGSSFKILPGNPSEIKKSIRIFFPADQKGELDALVSAYVDRRARVKVFHYNKNLNFIRDALKK